MLKVIIAFSIYMFFILIVLIAFQGWPEAILTYPQKRFYEVQILLVKW